MVTFRLKSDPKDDAPANIGASVPHVFDDAWPVAQKHFPKAVTDGILSQGSQATIPVDWDSSQTEVDIKGFKFNRLGCWGPEVHCQILRTAF